MADPGTLHHFQTALMNLVSEAQKIGLSLPVGLGIPSPYDLASTLGGPPLGRLRSEVHIATPDTQTGPSAEGTPQDQPEVQEGRERRKGKELPGDEPLERRGSGRVYETAPDNEHRRSR